MNAAIILAGGNGERLLGCNTPKQFIEVDGKPLIFYCLQTFEQCSDITLICVVITEEYCGLLSKKHIFAKPGKSRQHSVYNGLNALKPHRPNFVVIHDAARPLVTTTDIRNSINTAIGCDGATPCLPVTDTIYQSADGKTISSTFNRDTIFAGQTPECYKFEKYLAIHDKISDKELLNIRGSSEIAVNCGMKIAIAKGNPDNFKITTNADLNRFKAIVESP